MSSHALAGSHHTNHPGRAPFADDPRRACKDVDTNVFFPEDWDDRAGLVEAREICRRCIFRDACREWAIENEPYGYWGDTSASWRREERRRRNREAAAASEVAA